MFINVISCTPDEAMLSSLVKAYIGLKVYSIIEKTESSSYKYYHTEWETYIYINVVNFKCKNGRVIRVDILYVFVFRGL